MSVLNESRQLATFYLDDLHFGIDVMQVEEVIKFQPMTPVPGADASIKGLINLRGRIITAIDLRSRFQMPEKALTESHMNIVVNAFGESLSFLVDRIGDVIDVFSEQFEPSPDTLPVGLRRTVTGVYKLEKSLLLEVKCDEAADFGFTETLTQYH